MLTCKLSCYDDGDDDDSADDGDDNAGAADDDDVPHLDAELPVLITLAVELVVPPQQPTQANDLIHEEDRQRPNLLKSLERHKCDAGHLRQRC